MGTAAYAAFPHAVGQTEHAFLVTGDLDDRARQDYIADLRMHVLGTIGTDMRAAYDGSVAPAFAKRHGRAPKDAREIRQAMSGHGLYRMWSTMMVNCQDMMWESVTPGIERAQPHLNERVRGVNARLGSLTLDPSVEVPRYIAASDIHRMPGNYHGAASADDISQAALFDRGLYIYQAGAAGPTCDGNGRTQAEVIRRKWPQFKPARILDLGCTIGNNTLPYADVFPDAELHAIDVAAPCLKYGHARAEALGKACHFHQMNAEALRFEDASFDLVVSCILFHETSTKAVGNILAEAHRVLKPGGLMLHMEIPRASDLDTYDVFKMDWDAYYNNEPFMMAWSRMDMKAAATKAGFAAENYVHVTAPDFYAAGEKRFDAVIARGCETKTAVGHWGEEFEWHMFGAWK